jgi:hypothetical protein
MARMTTLLAATCIAADAAFPKVSLFERRKKKVARLTAELAKLEAERLSKLVVVFGCEVSYCTVCAFVPQSPRLLALILFLLIMLYYTIK